MTSPARTTLRLVVEGRLDEAVGRRLISECGLAVERVYGRAGWTYIRNALPSFNQAAPFAACLAMADFMDTGLPCPASVVSQWTPNRHANLIFRVVVRELESWLLADGRGIARFLRIPVARVPAAPEEEEDPKRTLVNLARVSRSRRVREALVPARGASAVVGPGYNTELERFIHGEWSPAAARAAAPSLDKCMLRLAELAERLT